MAINREAISVVFGLFALQSFIFVVGFASDKWWAGKGEYFGLWRKCVKEEDSTWDCDFWSKSGGVSGSFTFSQAILSISLIAQVASMVTFILWILLPQHTWKIGLTNVTLVASSEFASMIGVVNFALAALGPSPNGWGYWLCVAAATINGCLCLILMEMLFVEYRGTDPKCESDNQAPSHQPLHRRPPPMRTSVSSSVPHQALNNSTTSLQHNHGYDWLDLTSESNPSNQGAGRRSSRPMAYPYQRRDSGESEISWGMAAR